MAIAHFGSLETQGYLDGSRFDENVTFKYEFQMPVRSRTDLLLELTAGKRILHIGCCDHIPALPEKIAGGTWLHGTLAEHGTNCVGIDIDPEAVGLARSLSGLTNIFHGDVTAKDSKIRQISSGLFDYAVFGEVLEHVGNPVNFLQSFISLYKSNIVRIIITVPNAFRAGNVKNILRCRETINSDHRFFFTPFTLCKVAWDAGLRPISVQTALYSQAGRFKRSVINRFPLLAEDLVYVGIPR